ncbi:MAG TPA: hypothetical protein PL045_05680 [Chitinophagaceae bacterium]|nr:hypothetical protein [Chitinophagaceae bacterium]
MQRNNIFIYLFLSLAAVFAIYCFNPFALWFQNDDFVHIALSANGVLLQHNTFRPVCDISIMLDYKLWGDNAYGYHTTNLLLHIAVSVALFFLQKQLLKKYFPQVRNAKLFAYITAVLFFIYASHSEAVFWILGRSAALGALFSILFFIYWLNKESSPKYVAAYIFFFLLGLLSYESSWVLPAIIVILAVLKKEKWKHALIVFGIFLLYLLVRFYFIHEVAGEYEASKLLCGDIAGLAKNYFIILLRSVLPAYDNTVFFIASIVVIAGFAVAYFTCSSKSSIILLKVFLLLSCIPVASLGVDSHGTEGERFLYLPSVIVCIMFVNIIALSDKQKMLRYFLLFAFAAIQVSVLFVNAGNYQLAGIVCRLTIEQIQQVKNKSTIYISGLPQAQHGALIFRDGLHEAVQWLAPEQKDRSIIVCTQRSETAALQKYYSVISADSIEITECKGADPEQELNTVVFKFTNSALVVTK